MVESQPVAISKILNIKYPFAVTCQCIDRYTPLTSFELEHDQDRHCNFCLALGTLPRLEKIHIMLNMSGVVSGLRQKFQHTSGLRRNFTCGEFGARRPPNFSVHDTDGQGWKS